MQRDILRLPIARCNAGPACAASCRLRGYLPTHLPAHLPAHLPTHLPAHLPAYIPIPLPACVPALVPCAATSSTVQSALHRVESAPLLPSNMGPAGACLAIVPGLHAIDLEKHAGMEGHKTHPLPGSCEALLCHPSHAFPACAFQLFSWARSACAWHKLL